MYIGTKAQNMSSKGYASQDEEMMRDFWKSEEIIRD